MGIGMILFWGLVILGIVWLVRELGHSREAPRSGSGPDAIGILERRGVLRSDASRSET